MCLYTKMCEDQLMIANDLGLFTQTDHQCHLLTFIPSLPQFTFQEITKRCPSRCHIVHGFEWA